MTTETRQENPSPELSGESINPHAALIQVAQLTEITQSLSHSLMAAIQSIERLNQRIQGLEERQRTAQVALAKALLSIGTLAQHQPDEDAQQQVFKALGDALAELKKPAA